MPHDVDDLDSLSNAALALGEIGPDEDLYHVVAEQLARLAPESLVVTISADEPRAGAVVVRAVAGPEEMQRAAWEVNGEPVGLVFPVDAEGRQILTERKLLRLEGGMRQLTFRSWPAELARRFEEQVGIRSVYGQVFSHKGDFLGAVAIVSRAPSLEHARYIEVFIRLASVALQRQRAEAKLRESECRFRMLAENSQDVIFRLRLQPEAAFEYVSPAVLRMSGHTPEELYANPRLAPCLFPAPWIAGEELRELPGQPLVARCSRKDGTFVWTEQTFTPTRDASGRIVILEGAARDISKRKEAEDALLEVDRRKTEFLAVLSHELRNPLGAISNSAYLLRILEPARGEQARRALEVIERQIIQLRRLIDDLLDVTRISRGKIQLKPERVELNELVKLAVEDSRALFTKAQIELEVHVAPRAVFIRADRTRIHQVVGNLLQNAAKFTPAGGRASVSVETDEALLEAVVRVHNSGTRIPPELLERLFDPFVQADRTLDRGKGGLGLGLALVKGIVLLHRGRVEVTSEELEGTQFTIRLPLDTTLRKPVPPVRRPEPARAPHRRVLVIEDNADAANSLCEVLGLHDNTVAVAGTGPEGIELSHEFKPDVVLCDIGLPGMDGYEVARSMRADPELHDVALVALSGYASADDVERARQAGFDRHVAKPPDIDMLERVMSEAVRR